jgi:hypothetical protein
MAFMGYAALLVRRTGLGDPGPSVSAGFVHADWPWKSREGF